MTIALAEKARNQLAKEVEQEQALSIPEAQKAAMNLFNPEGKAPEIESLPRVEIVHAAQLFKMPGGSTVEEFTGAIIEAYKCNAWWPVPFEDSGGGTPPTCSSLDAIKPDPTSEDVQSDICITCKWGGKGAYGTANNGKGKACRNMRRLFMLVGGYNLPLQLSCAPTSLKAFADFSKNMYAVGWPYQAGNVTFSLEKVSTYAILKLSIANIERDMEVLQNRLKTAKQFMKVMHQQEFTLEEYIPES